MGKEAKENNGMQEVGRYNVRVTLLFMNKEGNLLQEVINCKTWMHAGLFLALTLFDGTLRLVCLNQYHGFSINALDQTTLESLN